MPENEKVSLNEEEIKENTENEIADAAAGEKTQDGDEGKEQETEVKEDEELSAKTEEGAGTDETPVLSEEDEKAICQKYPGLSSADEKEKGMLASLIRTGISPVAAYRALHYEELFEDEMKAAAKRAAADAIKKLTLHIGRPDEGGEAGNGTAIYKTDVSRLDGKAIRDILERVEKGEKIEF